MRKYKINNRIVMEICRIDFIQINSKIFYRKEEIMKNKKLTTLLILSVFAVMAFCLITGCGDDSPVSINQIAGPTGPGGATGPAGATGTDGPTGATGAPGVVSVGTITGTIFDAVTGDPIPDSEVAGMTVTAVRLEDGVASSDVLTAQVATGGTYTISGLVVNDQGTTRYRVSVSDEAVNIVPQPTPIVEGLFANIADNVEKYAPQNRVVTLPANQGVTQDFNLVYVYPWGEGVTGYLTADFPDPDAIYEDGYADITGGAGFPFYGNVYQDAFMGVNGYITFNNGHMDYFYEPGDILSFLDPNDPNSDPVLGGLMADLSFLDQQEDVPRPRLDTSQGLADNGGMFYNYKDGAHVFTWLRAGQYSESENLEEVQLRDPYFNTFQIVLFDDTAEEPGAITVYWNGIESTGSEYYWPVGTGISPGGNTIQRLSSSAITNTDFSSAAFPITVGPDEAIGQEFNGSGNPPYFNMDGGFLLYSPVTPDEVPGDNGYNVTYYPLN